MIIKNQLLTDFNQFGDDYLLRFCRARKFELEKVYKMFSEFILWRRDFGVDDIEVFSLF